MTIEVIVYDNYDDELGTLHTVKPSVHVGRSYYGKYIAIIENVYDTKIPVSVVGDKIHLADLEGGNVIENTISLEESLGNSIGSLSNMPSVLEATYRELIKVIKGVSKLGKQMMTIEDEVNASKNLPVITLPERYSDIVVTNQLYQLKMTDETEPTGYKYILAIKLREPYKLEHTNSTFEEYGEIEMLGYSGGVVFKVTNTITVNTNERFRSIEITELELDPAKYYWVDELRDLYLSIKNKG